MPRTPRRLRFLVKQVGLPQASPAWRRSPTAVILLRRRGRIEQAFRSFRSSLPQLRAAPRRALAGFAAAEQNRTTSTALPLATRRPASFRRDARATPSRVQRPAPRRRRSILAYAGPRHDRPLGVVKRLAPARPSADATRLHPHRRERRQEISRQGRSGKAATTVMGVQFGMGKR